MFRFKKKFRVIKSSEAHLIDGEWVEVYRAQFKYSGLFGIFGKWLDVKKPEVYTTNSPVSDTIYTEVRYIPAIFKSVTEAKEYCVHKEASVEDKSQEWYIVKNFTI